MKSRNLSEWTKSVEEDSTDGLHITSIKIEAEKKVDDFTVDTEAKKVKHLGNRQRRIIMVKDCGMPFLKTWRRDTSTEVRKKWRLKWCDSNNAFDAGKLLWNKNGHLLPFTFGDSLTLRGKIGNDVCDIHRSGIWNGALSWLPSWELAVNVVGMLSSRKAV